MTNHPTHVYPQGMLESAELMIIGGQPTKFDFRNRQPFSSNVGRLLEDLLALGGLNRSQVYLTNCFKDLRPVSKFRLKKSGLTTTGREAVKALKSELAAFPGKLVLAVGEEALNILTGRTGIDKWRSSLVPCSLDKTKSVFCVQDLTSIFPPKCVVLNKYLLRFDFEKMFRFLENGLPETDYVLKIKPTYHETIRYLDQLRKVEMFAYDIEVTNQEVSCISFAHDENFAISIPFIDGFGDYFTAEQETRIWIRIAELLQNPRIRKLGQNLTFDVSFLFRKYGIHAQNLEDTMIAQHVLYGDFKKGLDFITAMWTDLPYYKADGKQWIEGKGGFEKGWRYNALDSLVCMRAFPRQLEALQRQGNVETYERTKRIILPIVFMMEHGIESDPAGILAEHDEHVEKIKKLEKELHNLAGYELNYNSNPQLKKFFYEEKKFSPYMKDGKPTVDDLALKRLIRKGSKEAKVIQKIRKLAKVMSTYLQVDKLDEDGRIRCSFNPVGTRYSRLSSGSNIFETGMNLQNWPHKCQLHLHADAGYIGYAIDLSQAENRLVAYVGRVKAMIECFELGQDVHDKTTALIYEKLIEEVSRIKGTSIYQEGKSERDDGKKGNHSFNYNLTGKQFALRNEIPEKKGIALHAKYHAGYPEVQEIYHAEVREALFNGRTLTNLMGRKVLFLGPITGNSAYKTFNQAYNCIPQSTVGDIINERGLNFVYYDERFHEVELLNQVHDEIVFQIPAPWHDERPVSFERHIELLKLIVAELEKPLTVHGQEFVIPADVTVFTRFKQGVDLKELSVKKLKNVFFLED